MRFDSYAIQQTVHILDQTPPTSAFVREYYRLLMAYYLQNGAYDYINKSLQQTTELTNVRAIRNPANRVAEFYAAKLWPGALPDALPISTDNPLLVPAIHQLWTWSNFSSTKQRWARLFAIYGDLFVKVSTHLPSSVYMTLLMPQHVTDFETDQRGFLTWIRIDVPLADATYTEVWSKPDQELTIWQSHDRGVDEKLERLPPPSMVIPFSQVHGEDFIPIVYQPFRDDGVGRGSGAYSAQLEKIDEVNRQATRLAQMLFRHNKPLWVATSNGVDAQGRPLPPVAVPDDELTLDEDIISLPAMSDLKPLVPSVNFADALAVLEAQMQELSRDLPELAYYQLMDSRDLSGRAIKFMLDNMISRVEEARGNAESALIRVHEMALTVGQNFGLFPAELGTWEAGDFAHRFDPRPILPEDQFDTATLIKTFTDAGASLYAAARVAGLSEEEASDLAQIDLFGFEEAPPQVAGPEGESEEAPEGVPGG